MPEENKPTEQQAAKEKPLRRKKDTVKIGRKEIKTKLCNLKDSEKAEIVAEIEEIRKLTADDVTPDGKIEKKDNK